MIKFYLESMVSPGYYFKWQDTFNGVKVTTWTDNMEKAHHFDNSVKGIHYAQKHFPHHDCKIRQQVDYSDMYWG